MQGSDSEDYFVDPLSEDTTHNSEEEEEESGYTSVTTSPHSSLEGSSSSFASVRIDSQSFSEDGGGPESPPSTGFCHNRSWKRCWRRPDDGSSTPLPKKQLFVIGCIFMSEIFSLSMLFPFVAFMVADFGITNNDSEIGYYAGVLASCFSIAQFISSFWWGTWSDRVGRKRVLMIGMSLSTLAVLFFGLSLNYYWAVAARFAHGIVNGNIGVAKSYIGDITDKTNQSAGLSFVSVIIGVGVILGPTIGGYLSEPVDKYPLIFKTGHYHTVVFDKFPYLLPCMVSALISFIGLIGGAYFLKDVRQKATEVSEEEVSETDKCETISLSSDTEEQNIEKEEEIYLTRCQRTKDWITSTRLYTTITDGNTGLCCILYAFLTFCVLVFVEVFSLWVILDYEDGGLNFSSNDIGTTLAVVGVTIVVYQFFFYNMLAKKYGTLFLFRSALALLIPVLGGFPMINAAHEFGTVLIWVLVISLSIVRGVAATTAFTASFSLVNNACSPAIRGSANGLSESMAAISKSIGPVIGGVIFAWSVGNGLFPPLNYYLVFEVLAFISFLAIMLSYKLDNSIDNPVVDPNKLPQPDLSIDETRPLLDKHDDNKDLSIL